MYQKVSWGDGVIEDAGFYSGVAFDPSLVIATKEKHKIEALSNRL